MIASPDLARLLTATALPPIGQPWEEWYGWTCRVLLADVAEDLGRQEAATWLREAEPLSDRTPDYPGRAAVPDYLLGLRLTVRSAPVHLLIERPTSSPASVLLSTVYPVGTSSWEPDPLVQPYLPVRLRLAPEVARPGIVEGVLRILRCTPGFGRASGRETIEEHSFTLAPLSLARREHRRKALAWFADCVIERSAEVHCLNALCGARLPLDEVERLGFDATTRVQVTGPHSLLYHERTPALSLIAPESHLQPIPDWLED